MFVLMQTPSVPDPKNPNYTFYTIGLRELYPNDGYNSCDKFGKINDPFPNKMNEDWKGKFAFIPSDKKSIKKFKGKTTKINGITFARVFFKK